MRFKEIKEIVMINLIMALITFIVLVYLVLNGFILEALIPLVLLIIIILNYNIMKTYMKLKSITLTLAKIVTQRAKTKELLRKPRRRYLVFRVLSEKELDEETFKKAIMTGFREIVGDLGLSQTDIRLILYESKSGCGILRFNHTYKDLVLLCLALIRNINDIKVAIIPYKTTGTIKRAQEILKSLTLD